MGRRVAIYGVWSGFLLDISGEGGIGEGDFLTEFVGVGGGDAFVSAGAVVIEPSVEAV